MLDIVDYYLAEFFRVDLRKALDPNKPADFLKIQAALGKATQGLVGAAEAKALKEALGLLDVDWKSMDAKTKAKVVGAAKLAVNPVKVVMPKLQAHFEANAEKLGKQTKEANTTKKFGGTLSPNLNLVDKKILKAAAKSQAHFVTDEYGNRSEYFSKRARNIVERGLKAGKGSKEIGRELKEQLTKSTFDRSQAYWNMIAGVFANRARTYVNLASFAEVGFTEFEFDSVLDERTSNVCRFMHGRRFRVQDALASYAAVSASSNPEDVKTVQPWLAQGVDDQGNSMLYHKDGAGNRVQVAGIASSAVGTKDNTGSFTGAMGNSQLAAAGIMTPPLHGNCRSTINPVATAPRSVSLPTPPAETAAPLVLTNPDPMAAPMGPRATPPATPPPPPSPDQVEMLFGEGAGIDPKPVTVPAVVPEAQPVAALKLTPDAKIQAAVSKLKALQDEEGLLPLGAKQYGPKVLADPMHLNAYTDALQKAAADPKNSPWQTNVKNPETFKYGFPNLDAAQVLLYLENPKLLKQAEIKVVQTPVPGKKKLVQYLVVGNPEAAKAYELLGKNAFNKIKVQVLDADAHAKTLAQAAKVAALQPEAPPLPPTPKPAPKAPKNMPPPVGPPVNLPPPVDASNILHEKTGAAAGSNKGGFYTGKDGVKRYVKEYADPSQAHCEVLANSVYKSLGLQAANARVFTDPATGKLLYASDIMQGDALGGAMNKAQAKSFAKGFVGDVLLGNWDAIGLSHDNVRVDAKGNIQRIDNGGSLLYRAQHGRKPEGLLDGISEWDVFFSPKNPNYLATMKKAGYNRPEDFALEVAGQIKDVLLLREKHGGWSNYLATYAPGFDGEDRARVVKMLEARTELLKSKLPGMVAATLAPKPPKPSKPKPGDRLGQHLQPATMPEKNAAGFPVLSAPPTNGVPPRAGLTVKELPYAARNAVAGYNGADPVPWDKLPNGETRAAYAARTGAEIRKASMEEQKAIYGFTGIDYGGIRRSEATGKPSPSAKRIADAFSKVRPEPGVVYRGLDSLDEATIKKWITWDHAKDGPFMMGRDNTEGTSSSTWLPKVAVENFMHGAQDSSGYKAFFVIKQRCGIPIQDISRFKGDPSSDGKDPSENGIGEAEILLPRDGKYRVNSVSRWVGTERTIIIELEQIEDEN